MPKSFIDDITRRVSDVADSAVQMTKDFTDVAKMNSAVSEEKKIRKNLFEQLGESYYDLHADEPAEDLASLVQEIRDSFERTADLETRVMRIRGRRACPSCESEMALDAKFCSVCGTELPPVDLPEAADEDDNGEPVCKGCGEPLAPEAKFCPQCGRQVEMAEEKTLDDEG